MTTRPARCILFAFAALTLSFFACGQPADSRPNIGSASPSALAGASPIHTPSATPQSVASLFPAPETPFAVKFKWSRGVPGGGAALFEWRQNKGVRRWDSATSDRQGDFTIQRDLSTDLPLGAATSVGCIWFRKPDETDPRVNCDRDSVGGTSDPLLGDLVPAIQHGVITREIGGREIAGHQASCYEFEARSKGVICVDNAGTPLYFTSEKYGSQPGQTIEATDVSTAVPDLDLPADLPYQTEIRDSPEMSAIHLQLPW
jgi:hypothetical protein